MSPTKEQNTTYYGADGRPLGTGRYFKGAKFRMSPHCHGCHIKINWFYFDEYYNMKRYGATSQMIVSELQHPEAIQKDGKDWHVCWMPCISPHYEMVYIEDRVSDDTAILTLGD